MEQKIINNRYLLIKQIGFSGFSSVYKAWDNVLERFVAIKKISEDLTTDSKFLEVFREEALNSAKLQHENIVQIYDFIHTDDDSYYVVMEFVDGKDLATILKKSAERRKPIPPEICAKTVRDIALALDYAYQKKDEISKNSLNIIHQDIAPNNILVYFDGRIKLTDFGISRIVKKISTESSDTFIVEGKYHYMSPEQASGDSYITRKSDIYSLGTVFFELLTGQQLFEGKESEIVEKVKRADFNKGLFEQIPEPLRQLLEKMLQKLPDDRPKTMEEIISTLSQYIRERKFGQKRRDLSKYLTELFGTELDETSKDQLNPSGLTGYIRPDELGSERNPVPLRYGIQEKIVPKAKPAVKKEKKPEPVAAPKVRPVMIKKPFPVKTFLWSAAAAIISVFLFEVLIDIPLKMTPLGKHFANKFTKSIDVFVDSIPGNANVSLVDEYGIDVAKERNLFTTPTKLINMKEGTYQLTLKKEGYQPVNKTIDVYMKKSFFVSKETNKFIIPFTTKLEIKSIPTGMNIYIDGKPTQQKTPATIPLEAGKHAVKLVTSDQDSIGSTSFDETPSPSKCILDLANNKNILNNDVWEFNTSIGEGNINIYQLKGQLLKFVRIDSSPSEADIYLDGSRKSAGKTPATLKMLPGKHSISLKKKGFTNEENPDLRVPILLKYQGDIFVKSVVSEQGDNQFKCKLSE